MNKTKQTFITLVKEAKVTPPTGAVKQCLDSLPDITRKPSLLPLLKLQLESLPASMYLIAFTSILLQFSIFSIMRPIDGLMTSSILNALITLVFLWHLFLSESGSMSELEKSCKYSYGQILFARILCVCTLTLTTQTIAIIPNSFLCQMSVSHMLASTLPTLLGTLGALIWANYVSNTDTSLLSIYLVNTLITSLLLEWILEIGLLLISTLLFLTLATLILQTKNLMNRRIQYETFNY